MTLYTLLMVDDDPSLRRLLAMLADEDPRFGRAGVAANAAEALDLAAEQPDVIVLDAALGSEDGLALIPRLREIASRALIAVFSSAPFASSASAARAGADVFVEKGTDPDHLLDLLARLVADRAERSSEPTTVDLRDVAPCHAGGHPTPHAGRHTALENSLAEPRRVADITGRSGTNL